MFDDFDFDLLNSNEFKEDSVREELILPIIKALGYKASGDNRVIRSKTLSHPFVSIGSQSRKISIVPDYVFLSNDRPYWILDAKAPNEKINKSMHVEQAYSYAIHPEIRAEMYALCNGNEFVLYSIRELNPILSFSLKDIENHWDKFFRILNPDVKANPALLNYAPDFGIHIRKMGLVKGGLFSAPAINTKFISRLSERSYTCTSTIPGDIDMAISLDFNKKTFKELLKILPLEQASKIRQALSQQPFYINFSENDPDVKFGMTSNISNEIHHNAEESYIPFIVKEIFPYNHSLDEWEELAKMEMK
ncbi:type I restriction enzyme HsdR N-terminal domain-containing protein [Pectobacterium jejuense]|uniref:type I restriction enzyme HsdR N-terminal domain-containing protein n=1 Tax=Pectobacterium jejuense TaxID=2974022 RepID=UPI002282340B|nr:type I restriction enzyme HsdR N-terminal domain-containing protein [Pectobacterium jejuense]MCY9847851.1 type I restriction enzyme HsdR N-terminal domain-containing protein [Pectobacterium jejuense]